MSIPSPLSPPPRARIGLRTLLFLSLATLSCQGERGSLRTLAPELPAGFARHLLSDDDDAFAAYASGIGTMKLMNAKSLLERALDYSSQEGYLASAAVLDPLLERLAENLSRQYLIPDYLGSLRIRQALPAGEAIEMGRTMRSLREVYYDMAMPIGEKIDRVEETLQGLYDRGYTHLVPRTERGLYVLLQMAGRNEESLGHLRRALDAARENGQVVLTCELLGYMGNHFMREGKSDSMALFWEEGREIAIRSRLPEHAANFDAFYATYYQAMGRLGLAGDLLARAQETCRDFKGGYKELRFLWSSVRFLADLGCWEVVERQLQKGAVLFEDLETWGRSAERRLFPQRFALMGARVQMARGETGRAEKTYASVEEEVRRLPSRTDYASLLESWSSGLIAEGEFARARPIIDRGFDYAVGANLEAAAAGFTLLRARAEVELGEYEEGRASLRAFLDRVEESGLALRGSRIEAAVLEARIEAVRGDRKGAAAILERAYLDLLDLLCEVDASAEGYLVLGGSNGLRTAIHDFLGKDALPGYLFEVQWRAMTRLLGMGRRAGRETEVARTRRECEETVRDLLARAAGAGSSSPSADEPSGLLRRLGERRAAHIVYQVRRDRIDCWLATGDGVELESLAVDPDRVRRSVTRAIQILAGEPGIGGPSSAGSAEEPIAELSRLLLPAEVRRAGGLPGIGLVLVTPDHFLESFPFEALPLEGGRDAPVLLDRYDVAYLRSLGGETLPEDGPPGLILSAPRPSPEILRRYSSLGILIHGAREGREVAAAFPDARILSGKEARKDALVRTWEEAGFLYFTSHFIRHPEVPYLTFLPLSAPPGLARPDESLLEISDIRGADLGKCALVVLSGCASGAPYVTLGATAPGLADAFLDAGAAAAVQTLWRVRDENAHALMKEFLREWVEREGSPFRALCAARRTLRRGREGEEGRGASTWAAYTIKLGSL